MEDSIHFDFTRDDYLAYAHFMNFEGQNARRWKNFYAQRRIHLTAAILGTAFLIFAIATNFKGTIDPGNALMVGIGGGVAYAWWYTIRAYKAGTKSEIERRIAAAADTEEGRAAQGPKRITLSPSGILWESRDGIWFMRWTGIAGIQQSDRFLFLALVGRQQIPIPKRIFPSPEDLSAFIKRCEQYLYANPRPEAEDLRTFLEQRDVPCPGCSYNLRGSPSSTCPECGREFTLAQLIASLSQPRTR